MVITALFCVAIRRDSVSLLRFHFLSYVQAFSLGCRLEYPYSCFSFHFCFLVIVLLIFVKFVLFLIAVISLSLLLPMYRLYLQYWRVLFLPLFLKHILFMSWLGCKALCIVVSFLVLWYISESCSLAHFKNGPKYLRGISPCVYLFDEISAIIIIIIITPCRFFPQALCDGLLLESE